MSILTEFFSIELAFAVFVGLYISSRIIAYRSMSLLADADKVKLVDASSKSWWWWVLLAAVIGLFFLQFALGVVALAVYFIAALAYNTIWAVRNKLPRRYIARVSLANVLVLVGIVILGIGYASV